MKHILLLIVASLVLFCGCGASGEAVYQSISQEKAKEMMDNSDVIILDVRTKEEYDSGHITNAILLNVEEINEDTAKEVIPSKESTVLVYCRSGKRSKRASEALAKLGYSAVYEFGGINTWAYDIEY